MMNINQYITNLYKENIILDDFEEKILRFAKENQIPALSVEKGKFLETVVSIKNPARSFEIGLGSGFSTYKILKSISDRSSLISTDFNFFRIDYFYENVYRYLPESFKRKISVYPLDAFYITEKFIEINRKFDFIFLDATKKDYLKLLNNLIKLLNENGVLLVDNISYKEQTFKTIAKRSEKYLKGVQLLHEFNRRLINDKKLSTTFIPIEDGMSLSVKIK
jgi:predicted O-methyltransferase YrrM